MNPLRNSTNRALRSRQFGMSLVEVLVAVLVLSIGLLGLAGLQMRTLRNNESSLQRGVAVFQSHAIADAMRIDRVNASNGAFDLTVAAAAPTGTSFAESMLGEWRANLITALGESASGGVACDGNLCDIEVRWNDERGSAGSTTMTVRTQVQL